MVDDLSPVGSLLHWVEYGENCTFEHVRMFYRCCFRHNSNFPLVSREPVNVSRSILDDCVVAAVIGIDKLDY